jgi:DNA-binding transcriptional MocR family regulator
VIDERIGAQAIVSGLGSWRDDALSLSDAIARGVREAILDGRIPVGARLPSERALAQALDVSRGTLVATLSQLRRDGWLQTRHGSGSHARLPPSFTDRTTPWSLDHPGTDLELDMTQAVTAAPYDRYLDAAGDAIDRFGPILLDDGGPGAGLPELRDVIAARYTAGGLLTRADQILVTSGAQAALALLLDELHNRRRPVLVESPTYHGALRMLRRRQARLVTAGVTTDGWDRDHIDHAVRTTGAALAYLMPDFHNPTGALMAERERHRLARLADRHQMTVLVDETMRDLDLRIPAVPPAYLAGRQVIAVGSTSKIVWGGLRIGWIRASATLIQQLLRNPLQAGLSSPPLEQLIAVQLLADPDELLSQRRAQLRTQRDHLAALLADHEAWSFTVPPGGLAIWLRLHHTTARALAGSARDHGLALAPGPQFSADGTLTRHIRIPFTAHPPALTRAVAILRQAEERAR